MPLPTRFAPALLLLALLAACQDTPAPTAPEAAPPLREIRDAERGGSAGFFFLPPLVPAEPVTAAPFDPSLQPTALVCELSGDTCGRFVAGFLSTFGNPPIRVNAAEEAYEVAWDTRRFDLDPVKTYRLRVYAAGEERGFLDLDVVTSEAEAAAVDRSRFTPLIRGQTLAIRFRFTAPSNPHLFFFPPLAAAEPTPDGAFNPRLLPVVEVCRLVANACAGARTRLPAVQLLAAEERYRTTWDTGESGAAAGSTWRLFVRAGATVLGQVDLEVVSGGDPGGPSNGRVRVPQGAVLPVAFRIERGALSLATGGGGEPAFDCAASPDCVEATVPAGATEPVVLTTPEGHAGASFPPGWIDPALYPNGVNVIIGRVEVSPADPCLPTDMQQAEACYRYETVPFVPRFRELVTVGMCLDPNVDAELFQLWKYSDRTGALDLLDPAEAPFLECEDFGAPPPLGASANPLARRAHAGLHALAGPVARFFGPALLYAGDRRLGGLAGSFSRIGWAQTLFVEPVAGDAQIGEAGQPLPVDPAVRVTAGHGPEGRQPVAGVPVTFSVTEGGGAVGSTTVTTDEQGIARVRWTLGPDANQTLQASAPGGGPRGDPAATATLRSTTLGLVLASVSAGDRHTCGVSPGGVAYCWGDNEAGQLGNGSTTSSTTPVRVAGGLTFRMLGAGNSHTCGLTPTGEAFCWGANASGQLGNGTTTGSTTPVPVSGGLTFRSVDGGFFHTCGVSTGGEAYCWGANSQGQLGIGSVSNAVNTPVTVAGNIEFVDVGAGLVHSCGIAGNGTVYCWGRGQGGQLGTGTTNDSPVPVPVAGRLAFASLAVGAGSYNCGVSTNGVGYCWGIEQLGRLGIGETAPAVCSEFPCAPVPTPIAGGLRFLQTATQITAGGIVTCGTVEDDQAYCWGANGPGGVGDGTTIDRFTPTPVQGNLQLIDLGIGRLHSCGVARSGAVYCWGWNEAGQLGDGTTEDRLAPVRVRLPAATPPPQAP